MSKGSFIYYTHDTCYSHTTTTEATMAPELKI